jgi:hypothetical protein
MVNKGTNMQKQKLASVATVLLFLVGCSTTQPVRQISQAKEVMKVGGFVCPVKGSEQVSVEQALTAMPPGSEWISNQVIFITPSDDNMETYEYNSNITPNEHPASGVFQVASGASQSTNCLRQIHLVQESTESSETNVWEGYVYIEMCNGKKIFTPKKDVLEYAGSGEKRTRQTLKAFWFEENEGKCVMQVRVPSYDYLEGRDFGVSSQYTFPRSK